MRLYGELASWWPLLSPPREYVEEATWYCEQLKAACTSTPRTLLELGSGGGNNACHMKREFDETTLVDLSPDMLAVSRDLNPDCDHHEGDMRTVRLGRQFDCVFVHDAVVYMQTEEDLRKAIATAFEHCRPGGSALIAPDHVRESFEPSTDHGGTDAEGRGLRYLEWTWDPDPSDTTYVVDYACILRERDGSTRTVHDRHVEGLFSRSDWLSYLAEAGFSARAVAFDHSELEPGSYEVFVAARAG